MFKKLQEQLKTQFKTMTDTGNLYVVDYDKERIWNEYIFGYPSEHQQEHTCNSCRSFLRQYGGVVAIKDGLLLTLWDFDADVEYKHSVANLRRYIKSLPIADVFITEFANAGTSQNPDTKRDIIWNHFYLPIPLAYYVKKDGVDTIKSEKRTDKDVLKRSLDELTIDATESVLELIASDSLYRGTEFKLLLDSFLSLQQSYKELPDGLKDNWAWHTAQKCHSSINRIRNTSIGTLLIDLSAGVDLDVAVAKFEKVVAPTNYKRPTALVTPKMVDAAKLAIAELGYMDSLDRRFATEADLIVNDILYIDKSSSIKDVFDVIKEEGDVNPRTFSKTEEIAIGDFIKDVLPKTKRLEVLVENNHLNNFASILTATKYPAALLFKWNNPFSWAYTGGITDSIKERVKAAGGKVDGEVRISLSWSNYDDLDLHVVEPNGHRIYFSDKRSRYGALDVDMNAPGTTHRRDAVENVIYPTTLSPGRYKVFVHQFNRRETTGDGYSIQIESRGEIYDVSFKRNPKQNEFKLVAEFDYSTKNGLVMVSKLQSSVASKDKWGIKTNRFHKAKFILNSPNHWQGNAVGNLHTFFILENCASDEATRPFFNEYLKQELDGHRKFLEILGSKLLIAPTTRHLAGLGFSSTQRNSIIVRVQNRTQRLLKINF